MHHLDKSADEFVFQIAIKHGCSSYALLHGYLLFENEQLGIIN